MKYEYLHRTLSDLTASGKPIEAALNEIGANGWELVGWLSTQTQHAATFIRVKGLLGDDVILTPVTNANSGEWSQPAPDIKQQIKKIMPVRTRKTK